MGLAELQQYAVQISTLIREDTSTIAGKQNAKDQYDYLILISDSTITGINNELLVNSNLIGANLSRQTTLNTSNIAIGGLISTYTSSIDGFRQNAALTDAQISSLKLEYGTVTSSLFRSDTIYKSTAVGYSSMYITYLSKKTLHEQSLQRITSLSSVLADKIKNETISYSTLQTFIGKYNVTSQELSTLYLYSNAIKSTLTQYRIDEARLYSDLVSTNNGIVYLSSMYITNLINKQYFEALSTETSVANMYANARSTLAGLLMNQTGGSRKDIMRGGADTTLAAAIALAQQRADAWAVAQSQADAQVSALEKLVAGASADTYTIRLATANAVVELEAQNIRKFNAYAVSSLNAVAYFSSIYESALAASRSSLAGYSTHVTLYNSSMGAYNFFTGSADQDQSTIRLRQNALRSYSLQLSTYLLTYGRQESSFNGWIGYSSLMDRQISSSRGDIKYYSTLYERTNKTIANLTKRRADLSVDICNYEGTIRANAVIREKADIQTRRYNNLINTNVLGEEVAAFAYRETFARQKRLDLQAVYDSQILRQIQATSTLNGNLIAQKTTVSPVLTPINLNTPAILTANDTIMATQNLIDGFPAIYANYAAHTTNLSRISSSIAEEYSIYSSITSLSTQLLAQPTNSSIMKALNTITTNYIAKQNTTTTLRTQAALTQQAINSAKNNFASRYNTVFTASEQVTNETAISSFLIAGWNSAVTLAPIETLTGGGTTTELQQLLTVVNTLAGSGSTTFMDATGRAASFTAATDVTVDSAGNVYVADNTRIRRITPKGVVTTMVASEAFMSQQQQQQLANAQQQLTTMQQQHTQQQQQLTTTQQQELATIEQKLATMRTAQTQEQQQLATTQQQQLAPIQQQIASAQLAAGISCLAWNMNYSIMYAADTAAHRIHKITVAGTGAPTVTVFAGTGVAAATNGTGTAAAFSSPQGLVVDSEGNVYVADTGNHLIRKITPAGVVTTFAGSSMGSSDGIGILAKFNRPTRLAYDSGRNVLYVTDTDNNCIRKIMLPVGNVTTLAGNNNAGYTEGVGVTATFNKPCGITVDRYGSIYVADTSNYCIRMIDPTSGSVALVAGITSFRPPPPTYIQAWVDGTGSATTFNAPQGITVGTDGTLYVADTGNRGVRTVSNVTYLAKLGNDIYNNETALTALQQMCSRYQESGARVTADRASAASAANASAAAAAEAWNSQQNLLAMQQAQIANAAASMAEANANRIAESTARISQPTGAVTTGPSRAATGPTQAVTGPIQAATPPTQQLATIMTFLGSGQVMKLTGGGSGSWLDGTTQTARFYNPAGVAIDSLNNLYIADSDNNRIRKITPAGVVTTLAGSGNAVHADGTGVAASFSAPMEIAIDSANNMYVADTGNHRIRMITPAGVVTTIAGNGEAKWADGVGIQASFNSPAGITLDPQGNIYVADTNNDRIRRIAPDRTVTTLAGYFNGYVDDVGTSARLNRPFSITCSKTGPTMLYFTDRGNNRIRRISPTGTVATVAGSGYQGYADENGINANFANPIGIDIDNANNLFIGDSGNNCIRKITPDGTVTTLAGTVVAGGADGTAKAASFNLPFNLVIGLDGGIYVADMGNNSIRKVGGATTPQGMLLASAAQVSGAQASAAQASAARASAAQASAASAPRASAAQASAAQASAANASAAQASAAQASAANASAARASAAQASAANASAARASAANASAAQQTPGFTTTVAGGGTAAFADGTGAAALFNYPCGISATDSTGNVYIADKENHRIRLMSPAGVVTTFAGTGVAGFADGASNTAQFNSPSGICIDSAGKIYITDRGNNRIRLITPGAFGLRNVTTLAGSGAAGFADGTGAAAVFNNPMGITIDVQGNLYVADYNNNSIRRVTPGGVVTTFAGQASAGWIDGAAAGARFNKPAGVAFDPLRGDILVADTDNHRIRSINSTGVVSTVAGNGSSGSADGAASAASFTWPLGLSADAAGNIYVADTYSHKIRKIASGVVTTLAGSGSWTFAEGIGAAASFWEPTCVVVAPNGSLLVADAKNNRIRRINLVDGFQLAAAQASAANASAANASAAQASAASAPRASAAQASMAQARESAASAPRASAAQASAAQESLGHTFTLAGAGLPGYFDATGVKALFFKPGGLAVDSAGNVFVADTENHRIRKITAGGVVTTIAGSGRPEFADGIGTAASFRSPTAVAVNAAGNILYVTDRGNYRIRRIDLTTNNVTTFAGSGTQGVSDSNTAATARFDSPFAIAVDSAGAVYVCDQGANSIRKITLLGVVSTVAGSSPTQYAQGMAIDSSNNIYIAEMQAQRISKITPAGVKTILAGSGSQGSADGTGTAASFSNPKALTVDATGTLYVADTDNSKIRKVTSTGVVTTLSLPVTLGQPLGVVADANGKLYIANTNLNTIIKTVVATRP